MSVKSEIRTFHIKILIVAFWGARLRFVHSWVAPHSSPHCERVHHLRLMRKIVSNEKCAATPYTLNSSEHVHVWHWQSTKYCDKYS